MTQKCLGILCFFIERHITEGLKTYAILVYLSYYVKLFIVYPYESTDRMSDMGFYST